MKNRETVLLTALCLTAPIHAQTIDETIEADALGRLQVENTAGSVVIEGWDREIVNVTGTLGGAERVDVERRGGRIVVKVVYPRRHSGAGASLEVSAPRGNELNVKVVSAEVEIRGMRGAQEVSTVSGDLLTEQFAEAVEMRSVSGDIVVRGNSESLRTEASSVSGNIELTSIGGLVAGHSVSGNLSIEGERLDEGEFATTSGDVSVRGMLAPGTGRLEAVTVSGDVNLWLYGTTAARYELATMAGDIANCFGPNVERASRYGPGEQLSFAEGDADARVSATTMSGDIELCRE